MATFLRNLSKAERANVLTHGVGLIIALIFVPILWWMAWDKSWVEFSGLLVFGLSLWLVYGTSSIYHYVQKPRLKFLLRKIDHISIYFLIAGTHTPFILYFMPNTYGFGFLAFLWSLVFIGIFYKLFFFGKWQWLSLLLYLGMGWSAVFTIPSMMEVLPMLSFHWIWIGGLSYSLGVIFFVWEKLTYNHAIWHLFVIGGSLGHFLAVYYATV